MSFSGSGSGLWCDVGVAAPEEMTRAELVSLAREQGTRIAAQDRQIETMAAQMAGLLDANETLQAAVDRLERLVTRNSGNSSMQPSADGAPGRRAPKVKPKHGGGGRKRGKQPGAAGSNLAWLDDPGECKDRFPSGECGGCGESLLLARDLGVIDSYQQHEIPAVSVKVTQYDMHSVACGCGTVHTASRPEGARRGRVGYGPNLQAFVTYLLVFHHIPVHRCVDLLHALTGAAPSVGFVHGLLARVAGLLGDYDKRVATLITLAYAVCCDETPLRVGAKTPKPGRKKAEKYLLVFCTDLYTLYQLGDRSLDTFKASLLVDRGARPAADSRIIVHDRYVNYDSESLGEFDHQLCTAHLLRDLTDAAETYPAAHWPPQIADALRGLIHEANLAREAGAGVVAEDVKAPLLQRFRDGVTVGWSETRHHGPGTGETKARNLLAVLRDRPGDVLRFTTDLRVPPTSNQAERDLRPAKLQQKISGRLTSETATENRYRIRGFLSTATKHGQGAIDVLRDALTGIIWIPPEPTPA
jgi:transposase